MDFKLAAILMIVFLAIGIVGTYAVVPETEIQIVNLPGEDVIVNQTVEILTADTSLLLDRAVNDFLIEIKDTSGLRKCDGDKYSFSEISIDETEDDYQIDIDGDDYELTFEVEVRYKESDLRSCYESYEVTTEYDFEENEVIVSY